MGIKLLDCTLRDGGYINNWEFGSRRIVGVINGLTAAGLDIVECGFLQDKPHGSEQSLYNSIADIERILPVKRKHTEYVVMMNSGGFDANKLQPEEASKIFGIRVVFHAHQANAALEECRIIKEKGYRAFLQPMGTDAYSDKALIDLIEKANEIEPYAFYFVDSLGVMNSDDIVRLSLLIHNNLKPNIILGFHSHNNLQLAFSNAQKLINMRLKREIIIDSSIYGMGRGGGNLHSELITNYMNENFGADYNVDWILRVYDEHIRILREKFSWGFSVPHYLAAVYKCHQNYGTYLMNRGTLPVTDIGVLLSRIPHENKRLYSEKLIDELYVEYIADKVDDSDVCKQLAEKLSDKSILLLGPGKSLITHSDEINDFIKANCPVVISINHVPDMYKVDFAFYSNRKRFEERRDSTAQYILTSNVKHSSSNAFTVDYMTLCNQRGKYSDNAALLLLSLLQRLGCTTVSVAGLDGYSGSDYYENELQNIFDKSWMDGINAAIGSAIAQYAQHMEIRFVTPSLYNKEHL
jgi:4-hydroxy 2-oxovalerate aldolase